MKKVALVTGGATRIGASIALNLSKIGYDIALHFNTSNKEALNLKKQIQGNGSKCELFKYDFSEIDKNFNLINDVLYVFSKIDLLINNASIFKKYTTLETDEDLFNKTFSINLKAPFFLIKDFAKFCKKGNIINILDTKITKNEFSYSIYTLSKKCLHDLTLMTAKEFGPEIRINGIAPGLILPPAGKNIDYLINKMQKIPLKKKGKLSDLSQAIEFLLNNQYITGQILYLDGGEHLLF